MAKTPTTGSGKGTPVKGVGARSTLIGKPKPNAKTSSGLARRAAAGSQGPATRKIQVVKATGVRLDTKQSRHMDKLKAAGYVRINTLWLNPEVTEALDRGAAETGSRTKAIEAALLARWGR